MDRKTSRPNQRRMGNGAGGPMMMSTEKPKNFKKSIKRLLGVLTPHKLPVIFVITLTILATAFAIVSPKILGDMTNQIVNDFISIQAYDRIRNGLPANIPWSNGTTIRDLAIPDIDQTLEKIPSAQRELIENLDLSQKPAFQYDKLANVAVWLVILYILSALANYISGLITVDVIMKIIKKMRAQLSEKINHLPISYFDRNQYGDTLSRITNDVDTIGQTLAQAASQTISAVIMIVGVIAMMISISWLMTIVAVIVIIISSGVVGLITKRSQKYFTGVQNHLGELNGHIEENYAGQSIIKSFSAEGKAQKRFRAINTKLYVSTWKSQFLSGLMMPIMSFIGNLGYVATAVLGGYLALNGRLSIGDIQAFIQYVGQMQQPIGQIAQIANMLQSATAAAERVFNFLDEPEESPDSQNIVTPKITGAVEFNNVSFSYEKGKKVIKRFSAQIKPGQKVAIVGPTGAGKTTIVNLLMRFYDPDNGVIKIDETNTKNMPRPAVRQLFGMVLQDTWLFNGTIYENLAYGNLKATDKQIKQAAINAHVDHFVKALPQGYQTLIEEDSENISVGEKQLLTIARAMIANAPMLILDEATSSVDTRTEVLIQNAMEKLMAGRTSFVIAHRLSTIKNADLILVMKDGNIIEQGTHNQLLNASGFYAKLYNSQFAS